VAAEIVHDDDVAGFEDRHELLFDIGAEAFAVYRPVEDAGCGEAITAKRAEEGQRLPMPMRREAAQAFASGPPAAQRGHTSRDPGLVDEDQALGIEPALQDAPSSTPARDIHPGLLNGEQAFF
jgi:hypothetical protein